MRSKFKLFLSFLLSLSLLVVFFCAGKNSEGTVTDIEGNIYNTIKIGNQVWMAENLRTTKYNDGTPIPHIPDSIEWVFGTYTHGYCFYNNTTNTDTITKFGALYNWHVVNRFNTKKIAPEGWHVPTDSEWDTLQNYLIINGYNWDGTKSEDKVAKSMASNTGWKPSDRIGVIGNDMSSNNSSGFSALPGGHRNCSGGFGHIGGFGKWWSRSSQGDAASTAYSRTLYYLNGYLLSSSTPLESGLSVRLVRD